MTIALRQLLMFDASSAPYADAEFSRKPADMNRQR